MYRSCASSEETSLRVVTDWMNVGGKDVVARALEMSWERRLAVCNDSLPPLRIAALPDLMARAAMFTTTSGRASKMTSKTPIGQVTRYSSSPSSSSLE